MNPSGRHRFSLEEDQLLSRSWLWELLRKFYIESGQAAWDPTPTDYPAAAATYETVPLYMTSNPFIAQRWVDLVIELYQALTPKPKTLYIFELGAGTGRFSYYFLQALTQAFNELDENSVMTTRSNRCGDGSGECISEHVTASQGEGRRSPPFKYILCDVSPDLITAWRAHPKLKPFWDAQLLDAAIFNVEAFETIELIEAKQQLSTFSEPVVLLGGYLFDTLRAEGYSVSSPRSGDDAPNALRELRWSYSLPRSLLSLQPSAQLSSQQGSSDPSTQDKDLVSEDRVIPKSQDKCEAHRLSYELPRGVAEVLEHGLRPYDLLAGFESTYSRRALSDQHALAGQEQFLTDLTRYYSKRCAEMNLEHLDFTVPTGAIAALECVDAFFKGPTLFITGDQGFSDACQIEACKGVMLSRHGSFSSPVNYEALRVWVSYMNRCDALGKGEVSETERATSAQAAAWPGVAAEPAPTRYAQNSSFSRYKFVESAIIFNFVDPQSQVPSSSRAYGHKPYHLSRQLPGKLQRLLDQFDMENYWWLFEKHSRKCDLSTETNCANSLNEAGEYLKNSVHLAANSDPNYLTVEELLVWIKLGRWDPSNFFYGLDLLCRDLESATLEVQRQWRLAAPRILRMVFPLHRGELELLNTAGALWMKLGWYQEALDYFTTSAEMEPSRVEFIFNQGLALSKLGRPEEAIERFSRAGELGRYI